jgi:hypothetical protein
MRRAGDDEAPDVAAERFILSPALPRDHRANLENAFTNRTRSV